MNVFSVFAFFNTMLAVIGVYLTWLGYSKEGNNNPYAWAFNAVWISLLLYSVYITLRNVKLQKRSKYNYDINRLHSNIHSINHSNIDTLKTGCIESCEDIRHLFFKLSGKPCHVNIKLFKGATSVLETFARDKESIKKRKDSKRGEVLDWQLKNSDFNRIIRMYNELIQVDDNVEIEKRIRKMFYLKNSLPLVSDFHHPYLLTQEYLDKVEKYSSSFLRFLMRIYYNDALCYKSVFTIPILSVISDQDIKDGKPLLGVISIDSPKWNVFDKKRDLYIMRGVADSLYKKIKHVQPVQTKNE